MGPGEEKKTEPLHGRNIKSGNLQISKLGRILKMFEKKTYYDSAWHGEGSEFMLRSLIQLCSLIAGTILSFCTNGKA